MARSLIARFRRLWMPGQRRGVLSTARAATLARLSTMVGSGAARFESVERERSQLSRLSTRLAPRPRPVGGAAGAERDPMICPERSGDESSLSIASLRWSTKRDEPDRILHRSGDAIT